MRLCGSDCDFAFLDEPVAWRREDKLEKTAHTDPIAKHLDKQIATVRRRFIARTHLLRYGHGDWNVSLQPADPSKRDWMVSSWTVAFLYHQLCHYVDIVRHAGCFDMDAEQHCLAAAMREDFNRFLVRDGTVAGYGAFSPRGSEPETGVSNYLLPMTQGIIGGLFAREQASITSASSESISSFPMACA